MNSIDHRRAGSGRGRLAVAIGLASVVGVSLASVAVAQPVLLEVGGYVAPDGSLGSATGVLIENGRIVGLVEPGTQVDGVRVLAFPDGVLCPGLIDVHSRVSVGWQDSEDVQSIDPGLVAIDLFDRHSDDLAKAVRGGITTAVLAPGADNLVGGRLAAVHTAGFSKPEDALVGLGPMKMSLSPAIYRSDREPTARPGALHLLRQTLDTCEGPEGDPRLRSMLDGDWRASERAVAALVDCPTRQDVSTMVELGKRYGLRLALMHGAELTDVAKSLAGVEHVIVVVPPLTHSYPQRSLAGPAALERLGVPFALAGLTPDHGADGLRISAALSVRYGASAEAVRRALTINVAQLVGLDVSTKERGGLGSIEAGKQADLVVFSADPLRLDARVEAVFVDGERVPGVGCP